MRIECLPSHPGLRDRLLALGIRPGVQLEVLRRGTPGGLLHLAHGLFEFMLRQEHAEEIAVTYDKEAPSSKLPPWYTSKAITQARVRDQATERSTKARLPDSFNCTATVERHGV